MQSLTLIKDIQSIFSFPIFSKNDGEKNFIEKKQSFKLTIFRKKIVNKTTS
jgi:hypothetical protein